MSKMAKHSPLPLLALTLPPPAAGFPLLVIHGRHDQLASPKNAEKLAKRLRAPCILLEGAHFIVRECAGQINMLLAGLVFGERHFQVRVGVGRERWWKGLVERGEEGAGDSSGQIVLRQNGMLILLAMLTDLGEACPGGVGVCVWGGGLEEGGGRGS